MGSFYRSGAFLNEALRWDGKKWSNVKTPNPGGAAQNDGNSLNGVACTSASNCWAAGDVVTSGVFNDELLHWNGKKWSVGTIP